MKCYAAIQKLYPGPIFLFSQYRSRAGIDELLYIGKPLDEQPFFAADKDMFVGPLSVVGAATQFANPSNYANFQASSGTGGKSGDDAAALALAGSVNINKISNKANVLIGQNSSITGSGKVDLKATAAQQDVAITGKIGLTGGANTAVGGRVSIHDGNVDSLVAVAGGASVAGSAITVAALNDVSHTGITISAGKGNDTGISGMVPIWPGTATALLPL